MVSIKWYGRYGDVVDGFRWTKMLKSFDSVCNQWNHIGESQVARKFKRDLQYDEQVLLYFSVHISSVEHSLRYTVESI